VTQVTRGVSWRLWARTGSTAVLDLKDVLLLATCPSFVVCRDTNREAAGCLLLAQFRSAQFYFRKLHESVMTAVGLSRPPTHTAGRRRAGRGSDCARHGQCYGASPCASGPTSSHLTAPRLGMHGTVPPLRHTPLRCGDSLSMGST
jgi:hypothetical protein